MRQFTSKVKESVWKALPHLCLLHPSEPWGETKRILNVVRDYISVPEGLKCKTQPFEKLLAVWYRVLQLLKAVAGIWITIWIICKIFITKKYVEIEFGGRQVSSRTLISPYFDIPWNENCVIFSSWNSIFIDFRGYLARRNAFLTVFLNWSRTQLSFHGLRLSSCIKTLSITN